MHTPTPPGLEFVAHVVVPCGSPIVARGGPRGSRVIVPILGGTAEGPRLHATVVPAGADFQIVRSDGVAEIEARYFLEIEPGVRVYVCNRGIVRLAPGVLERLIKREPVDPADVYFRSTPSFETGAPDLQWLARDLFLGTGQIFPGRVELDWFRVL